MDTKLAVFQDKFGVGLSDITVPRTTNEKTGRIEPDMGELTSLRGAMEQEWGTDAHMVTYQIPGLETPMRLNKACLPQLIEKGLTPVTTAVGLDWDYTINGDKAPGGMPDDIFFAVVKTLKPFMTDFPPRVIYSTKNGFRLIYELSEPIPVTESEPKIRWLIEQASKPLEAAGYDGFDPLADWTRLFRLPRVHRDNVLTQGHMYIQDTVLDSSRLGDSQGSKTRTTAIQVPDEVPSDSDVVTMRYGPKGDDSADWFQRIKQRLASQRKNVYHELVDWLFYDSGVAPTEEVGRNQDLGKWCGLIADKMVEYDGLSHRHLFALFYPQIMVWEEEEDRHDRGENYWIDVLWRAAVRMWDMALEVKIERQNKILERERRKEEKARQEDEREERRKKWEERQAARELDAADIQRSIIEGMKEWCRAPELHEGTDEDAWEYVRSRLILRTKEGYRIMQPNGYYDGSPVARDILVAHIRHHSNGIEKVINTFKFTDSSAQETNRRPEDILSDHGSRVKETVLSCGRQGDWQQADGTLIHSAYWLNPNIKPEYSEAVDIWLRKLAGSKYQELLKWIAWALDIENPSAICALSFAGSNGTGKSLLSNGLAECIAPRSLPVKGEELYKHNTQGLGYNPFLVFDEDIAVDPKVDIAAQFRSHVGGTAGSMESDLKGESRVSILSKVRLIFGANSNAIMSKLIRQVENAESLEATARRVLHIDMLGDTAAQEYLESIDTTDWCDRDSKNLVAKHFMWLHSQLGENSKLGGPWQRGSRFLVEGTVSGLDDIALDTVEVGDNRAWAVAVCDIIRAVRNKETVQGITITDKYANITNGKVRIKIEFVKEVLERRFPGERMTLNFIGKTFRHMWKDVRDKDARRWKEIDDKKFFSFAGERMPVRAETLKEDGVLCKIG